jgi:tetratricopeptide (TPR) repeat protein
LPYYSHLHYHWRPTCWTRPYYPVYYSYGYTTTGGSWLSIGGTPITYVNPFYVRPTTNIGVYFDYSQPIRVPGPNYQETREDLIRSERAINRFDDARELFRRGEYGRASELIDEAIQIFPNDPTLHQFRALVLFARKRYQEAAAVLYSVLAVSPGWDSITLQKLYESPRTYLNQIRDLEQYVRARPDEAEPKFLLAYHFASNGNMAGAIRMLEQVQAARPGDRVVESLLTAIRG